MVYIARDPRDVAISYAHFLGRSVDYTIDFMADQMGTLRPREAFVSLQLPQQTSAWSAHVTSWLDDSAMPVHLVRYEDMLLDSVGELKKIADFPGMPTDLIQQAAEATEFTKIQRQEEAKGFVERPGATKQFFRQGRAQRLGRP